MSHHVIIRLKRPDEGDPGSKLIQCMRCLESTHCASFIDDKEVLRRLLAFKDNHKDCKP